MSLIQTLGIQSPCQMMIGVYNHLLRKVFRFHYHSQKVIGSLGKLTLFSTLPKNKSRFGPFWPFAIHSLGLWSLPGDGPSPPAPAARAGARGIAAALGRGDAHELSCHFSRIIGGFGEIPVLPTLPG